jgi:hypothetical protein
MLLAGSLKKEEGSMMGPGMPELLIFMIIITPLIIRFAKWAFRKTE